MAAGVETLELKDSFVEERKIVLSENGMNGNAESEEGVGVAAAKSKKKKKKKKSNSHTADSSRELFQVLPSQELVESLFPWKAVLRARRGRCAIATR